uniref:Putative F-box protein SKIP1 n=1 Tax=Davidia involucrata TaxID=16924 RepID=A0A5B7BCM8_DAVIN
MFVCKSWLQACKDPCLNSVFDLEIHFDSSTKSPLWWTPEFERKVDAMLRSVIDWSDGSLTEIRVRHCSNRSLSLAAERCPSLQLFQSRAAQMLLMHRLLRWLLGVPRLGNLTSATAMKYLMNLWL